ncbi:MAG: hypothetical protein NTW20_10830, partial [Rhodobacterales bacterium]|nr:hypothetical protein [Rhodobacterales bacterium]
QTADLRLRATLDPETGVLMLSGFRLDLSGGTRLELDAEVWGATLAPASWVMGAVTQANLVWRNDGKVPRPVMDLAGEDMAGATGNAAVDAAREALARGLDALPDAALDDGSRKALKAVIAALPQGRGKLTLTFQSKDGIGAARIAILSLSGDPLSPQGLATILDGATITASWQPGLAP